MPSSTAVRPSSPSWRKRLTWMLPSKSVTLKLRIFRPPRTSRISLPKTWALTRVRPDSGVREEMGTFSPLIFRPQRSFSPEAAAFSFFCLAAALI